MNLILNRFAWIPLVMIMSSVVSAQGALPPDDGDEISERLERSWRNAGLTDEQLSVMRTLSQNHRTATLPLREQIRSAQQTLASVKPGDPNYDAVTAEARRSLDAARTQLRTQQLQFRNEVQNLLTPEQRAQAEARQQERRQRMQERRQQRPDGGMRDGRNGRPGAGGMPGGRPGGVGRGGRGGG